MNRLVSVGFASENVQPVIESAKWRTARLAWDVDLEAGDVVELVDEERKQPAAVALVRWHVQMDAQAFVDARMDGHRVYADVDDFADHMERYYPDRPRVEPGTPVDVIDWHPDTVLVYDEHPAVPEGVPRP